MKVIRVTTLLDFGGQEQQYISFTESPELLQNKYIFVAIGYGGNAEKVLREKGFEVTILNKNFSIKNLQNIITLYKLFKKIKPDIVHTAAAEANFHGILAAKLAGVKTIIGEEIGLPNHSEIVKKIFSGVYKFANKVVCVSESVKKKLIEMKEIDSKKGVVIYNPVSFPKKHEREYKDKFEIVYVGRLEKVKNVETLIRAFSKAKFQNLHLTIVGDGRERNNLESLAKNLNVYHYISFVGFSSEPSKYLSSANLFILPSYSEGFGIAAVEAMFLEIPVLCSNVGGITEFIIDNKNGWLFNPNNEGELTKKINQISALEKKAIDLIAEKGYKSVIERFTVEKYVSNLESFYAKNIKYIKFCK